MYCITSKVDWPRSAVGNTSDCQRSRVRYLVQSLTFVSLPLTPEGKSPVTCESMYTVLVNRSETLSKQKGNDQKLIQSHPTSDPQNQKGKKDTHKN